ncbi:TGF-beta receptor type-2-like [Lytechinus pictus]|uniref:TGF-beta receptor type-2-like n=1 Tax=Lytechinus pictus TaxID=7653 RepID=UPI00240D7147|nr:TGF-beta receptor type-2-like [Lytechinus pictus]
MVTISPAVTFQCLDCNEVQLDCQGDFCVPIECTTSTICTGYCLVATFQTTNGSDPLNQNIIGMFSCINDTNPDIVGKKHCQVELDEYSYSSEGSYSCTCDSDVCNKVIYMSEATLPEEPTVSSPSSEATTKTSNSPVKNTDPDRTEGGTKDQLLDREILVIVVCSVVPAVLLTIVIAVAGYIHITRYRQPMMDELHTQTQTSNTESTSIDMTTDESETKRIGEDSPPDSPLHLNGNYLPITLDELIGKGRFGAVWRANWKINNGTKERTVAVKVFFEYDSASWNVEKELFTDHSVMMRHEHIVQFISAEVRRVSVTSPTRQYWLITKYYKNGSLHEYLRQRTVNWIDLCKLCGSAARGLAHLHAETYGSQGLHKVPVAHRDLKSTNILVKDDGTCAIADFGLAIRLDPQSSTDQLANSGQVGTPRYMSPEALECKVNLQDIESFKQMDTYALALILWEITSRCTLLKDINEYELPFSGSLGDRRASLEMMKTLVVLRRERPPITDEWLRNPGLTIIKNTVVDCWDEDPEARLTASCVEARFQELIMWHEGEPHAQSFYTNKGRRGRTTLV